MDASSCQLSQCLGKRSLWLVPRLAHPGGGLVNTEKSYHKAFFLKLSSAAWGCMIYMWGVCLYLFVVEQYRHGAPEGWLPLPLPRWDCKIPNIEAPCLYCHYHSLPENPHRMRGEGHLNKTIEQKVTWASRQLNKYLIAQKPTEQIIQMYLNKITSTISKIWNWMKGHIFNLIVQGYHRLHLAECVHAMGGLAPILGSKYLMTFMLIQATTDPNHELS